MTSRVWGEPSDAYLPSVNVETIDRKIPVLRLVLDTFEDDAVILDQSGAAKLMLVLAKFLAA